MCAGKAEATAIVNTMNTANSQKGERRRCSRTETRASGKPECESVKAARETSCGRGASLSKTMCKGKHTANCSAANAHSACRQPQRSMHQANRGINTVLASPPKKVRVMMARRKSWAKRRVTTAKAGVYKVAAMPSPSQIQAI